MEIQPLVLLIEDDASISAFIMAILTANQYRALRAVSGREGLTLASSNAPDVILLDLGLPDMDGVEVLREIRAQSKTPVVIVSARGLERDKVAALDLGADDYIVKPFGTAELLARIRTALRHSPKSMGSEPLGLASKVIGELNIDYQKRIVTLRGEVLHLTPNEYKLLAMLSVNAGKVLTHDTLIREVWGLYGNDSHTLRVNMANLRRKIEENPGSPRYILTEMGVGYRMAEE
ncbi:KDP operon transcriptional regulatory protein KdpE [bioreactor metagenome]|uniref:KDP operon transcriptional regulatory protein KdpE n=1 Tax=bioreactor metagenome TaxID=1076179 RepID=A0A645A5L4_9ZZZZ|nr:response regulator transcription factor [Clostridia bacterium]